MITSHQYSKSQDEQGQIVFFCNLSFSVDEQGLMEFLRDNGFRPIRAKLLYSQDGRSKGQGFVEMASSKEATQVIDQVNG